jgi:hypothetical protein
MTTQQPSVQVPALLQDPALLYRAGETIEALGLAGEKENALMVDLEVISRSLDEPLNLVVKGPSSAGKNFLVEKTLQLHPREAYYKLTASSERALVYSDEEFTHRTVVMAEAHPMGIGALILRSLLSEGRIFYDTVDKTQKGLAGRHIEKEGPTGLIVTTTLPSLEPELETRLFSIEVSDEPSQTRAVMRKAAARYAGQIQPPDISVWLEAHEWLANQGVHSVVIPFAPWLANQLPDRPVRMRRDFPHLLSAISACALLHQCQRRLDADGRVVASIADYAMVRRLLGRAFSATSAESLTEAQRQAVEAVRRLHKWATGAVTYEAVARQLNIDRSAAQRRLERPLALGYVENEEKRWRRPAKLAPGAQLPGLSQLPDPEDLALAFPHLAQSWVDPIDGSACTPQTTAHMHTVAAVASSPAIGGVQSPVHTDPDSAQAQCASVQSSGGDGDSEEEWPDGKPPF